LAFVGSLLAASIGFAWWWSPSAHMSPSASGPLTQAAPKDAAPTTVALSSDLAQQIQPMTRDLADLRQAVEQLNVRQEQLVRDNENVASQLKASQEEMARNNSIIDQIKATQIQMARESQRLWSPKGCSNGKRSTKLPGSRFNIWRQAMRKNLLKRKRRSTFNTLSA
jgi:outer membrane murein-binding lipoprotein Lpp